MNTGTGKKAKVSRMVRMHAADIEDISEVGAGDMFALFGVDCASGETFCDINTQLNMTPMHVPEPVMSLTVKNKKPD
jgi:elongation factor G